MITTIPSISTSTLSGNVYREESRRCAKTKHAARIDSWLLNEMLLMNSYWRYIMWSLETLLQKKQIYVTLTLYTGLRPDSKFQTGGDSTDL